MVELNRRLREAARTYYQESREIMSNLEYDALYDELKALEEKTGIVLSDSVTQNVGYEILSQLEKVQHEQPMLSLDKTKSVDALKEWIGDKEAVLSWKLDGLTIVLTYEGGELMQAVTRGNGYIGEDITGNARQFKNVPLKIPYEGKLVLRGEAVIRYSDFEAFSGEYKNPRNLCSGSVRQLDPGVTRERNVNLFVFSLVSAQDINTEAAQSEGSRSSAVNSCAPKDTMVNQFEWLRCQGFEVVDHITVSGDTVEGAVADYAERIRSYDVPSDGLVLALNDIEYGRSLGTTSKFPRNAIAFKWSDELAETVLKYIEWSPSRTGLINPVAVFEPVEIEGTTVSRASVHNISILRSLKLGEGDRITVYKANMIIPQIAENLTCSDTVKIPEVCPVCGQPTRRSNENGAETLYCSNESCPVKKVKAYALFASRDAMNIDGMSEATMEKLIGAGFIKTYADIFRLERYRSDIAKLEGFGERSADNLIKAAEKARDTTVPAFIYSLGIPGIGAANAKVLSRKYNGDFDAIRKAPAGELCEIDGIGQVLADNIRSFFDDEKNSAEADDLLGIVRFDAGDGAAEDRGLEGLTFVITGDVHIYANRKELSGYIESRGGRTSGSVSSRIDYLINNDIASGSSKNKKAKELGVRIITEEEFVQMFTK